MKNPNKCRYIMFILIIIGFVLAGISGIIFGVQPVHPLFIVGVMAIYFPKFLPLTIMEALPKND